MCLYQSQFCLILLTTFLVKISLAISDSQSHLNLYCEIFENINFRGESLIIPDSHQVTNLSQITQSWMKSSEYNTSDNADIQFHSFKLPSLISSGIFCIINGCTSENFSGNCTVFKLSRKRIQSSRLKSFKCNCFNERNGGSNKNRKVDVPRVGIDSKPSSGSEILNCEDEIEANIFRNFTTQGKKIIGVGRNYIWHKTDLSKVVGNGTTPENPIIFLKPTSSYLSEGNLIHLPNNLGVIYYELELAVIIGKIARNVAEKDALDYVAGYALALDMTAKEVLKSSISKGLPWELAKGFDGACPIGNFIPKQCVPDPHDLQLSCSVNSVLTQNDSTSQMVFKIPQLISYVSQYMTLEPNDVILTGTPDGFGQIMSGDIIEGSINNDLAKIKFVVA